MADDASKRPIVALTLSLVAVVGAIGVLTRDHAPGARQLDAGAAQVVPPSPQASERATTHVQLLSGAIEAPVVVARIEGRVVDARDDSPVTDAELTFAHDGGAHQTRTDAQGRFMLTPAPSGHWALMGITASGHRTFVTPWGQTPMTISLGEGQAATGLLFRLQRRWQLSGQVRAADGGVLAAVSVRALGDTGVVGTALTDNDGDFLVEADPEGLVTFSKQGYLATAVGADPSGRVLVTLDAVAEVIDAGTAAVFGAVTDEHGANVVGAVMTLRVVVDGLEGVEAVTESGADGRFSFSGLTPGLKRSVLATAEGYAPAESSVGEGAVRLTLTRGAVLIGTVVGHDRGPLKSFTLLVFEVDGLVRRPRLTRAFVSDDGSYRITDAPVGHVAVVAASAGWAPGEEALFETRAATETRADFTLSPGAEVYGQVVDRATKGPLTGARVWLESMSVIGSVGLSIDAYSDEAGVFRLKGIAPGTRSVMAAASEYHSRIVSGLQLSQGVRVGPLVIDLARAEKDQAPKLELVGVGAALKANGERLEVEGVIPGGGAAEVGLKAGDAIHAIDGVLTASLGFSGSVDRIRGPEGTTVALEVQSGREVKRIVQVPRRKLTK